MVRAAVAGKLDGVPTQTEPVFGLAVPTVVPDVPSEILMPRATWADPVAYDQQAAKVANLFRENFKRFEGKASPAVKNAGPLAGR
jgi:phosphoenolpyruvate carboxykinase (ATP)